MANAIIEKEKIQKRQGLPSMGSAIATMNGTAPLERSYPSADLPLPRELRQSDFLPSHGPALAGPSPAAPVGSLTDRINPVRPAPVQPTINTAAPLTTAPLTTAPRPATIATPQALTPGQEARRAVSPQPAPQLWPQALPASVLTDGLPGKPAVTPVAAATPPAAPVVAPAPAQPRTVPFSPQAQSLRDQAIAMLGPEKSLDIAQLRAAIDKIALEGENAPRIATSEAAFAGQPSNGVNPNFMRERLAADPGYYGLSPEAEQARREARAGTVSPDGKGRIIAPEPGFMQETTKGGASTFRMSDANGREFNTEREARAGLSDTENATLTGIDKVKADTGKTLEETKTVVPNSRSDIAYKDLTGRAAMVNAGASVTNADANMLQAQTGETLADNAIKTGSVTPSGKVSSATASSNKAWDGAPNDVKDFFVDPTTGEVDLDSFTEFGQYRMALGNPDPTTAISDWKMAKKNRVPIEALKAFQMDEDPNKAANFKKMYGWAPSNL